MLPPHCCFLLLLPTQVVTAQYFVWYFSLLPLVVPHLSWPLPRGLLLSSGVWVAAQLHWLGWAYQLEFQVGGARREDAGGQLMVSRHTAWWGPCWA